MKDSYTEPSKEVSAEIKVKGSRFVAQIVPVLSQRAAAQALTRIRKVHYDATHNCSAWRIGPEGEEFRFSDDGEPSGTAGQPILRQIEGADLTNALVVVTRYYGGTKLGTGGLARAYGDAARAAIDQVPVVRRIMREEVVVRFAYDDTSPAMHTIDRFDVRVAESEYGTDTRLRLQVRASHVEDFRAAFIDALGGRGAVSPS